VVLQLQPGFQTKSVPVLKTVKTLSSWSTPKNYQKKIKKNLKRCDTMLKLKSVNYSMKWQNFKLNSETKTLKILKQEQKYEKHKNKIKNLLIQS